MGEDVIHPLKILVDDVYNGTSKKLSLFDNVICTKSKGKGSKLSASMKCPGCPGSGVKISIRHLGPSMIQQMQHACNDFKDHCPIASVRRLLRRRKFWRFMLRRECIMAKRSHFFVRLTRQY